MEIRQKLRIFHHWPIFGSIHFFLPRIWIFIFKFVCKIAFFLKISKHPRRGGGRSTVPHCVWKPKMVKNRAQKTSADFNTYLVNSKPQREYKKDLWRNLGQNLSFTFLSTAKRGTLRKTK